MLSQARMLCGGDFESQAPSQIIVGQHERGRQRQVQIAVYLRSSDLGKVMPTTPSRLGCSSRPASGLATAAMPLEAGFHVMWRWLYLQARVETWVLLRGSIFFF